MSETKKYYQNKVAVVTGGASGIGLALCEAMLASGTTRSSWPTSIRRSSIGRGPGSK